LGRLAFKLARRDRNRAIGNLQRAFTSADTDPSLMALRSFEHLGMALFEILHIKHNGPHELQHHFTAEGYDTLRHILQQHRSAIWVSGHLGNWELGAAHAATAGFQIFPVVRDNPNNRIGRFIIEMRQRFGIQSLLRDETDIRQQIKQRIDEGTILGILIDQDTRLVRSVFVDFFGQPAATISGAAAMAISHKLPLVVGTARREADGCHCVTVQGPVPVPDTGDRAYDIVLLTQELNRRLEVEIRKAPEQWVWFHDRWKRKPRYRGQVEVL